MDDVLTPFAVQYVLFFGIAFLLILSLLCFQVRPSDSQRSLGASFLAIKIPGKSSRERGRESGAGG